MLNERSGVITEDRFQKMTQVQWIFEYLVIQKYKKKDYETEKSKVDFVIGIKNEIRDMLILNIQSNNPELAEKIASKILNDKTKELNSEDKTVMDLFGQCPETVTVFIDEKQSGNNLKKKSRKVSSVNIKK